MEIQGQSTVKINKKDQIATCHGLFIFKNVESVPT